MYLKINCKNVVVYGVTLLICNNYLNNRLNSANAVELLGDFCIVCRLFAAFFRFACLYWLCSKEQRLSARKGNHNTGHALNAAPFLRTQTKANHSMLCYLIHFYLKFTAKIKHSSCEIDGGKDLKYLSASCCNLH